VSKGKHIPLRTCIGCGEKKPKRELLRIVRGENNSIFYDPTGKASGRGAYICPKIECLELAIKKRAFSHALKCEISKEDLERIREELEREITKRGEMVV
jgi:predicted RNA-binding protein YlxR (DUF448 family)